MGERERDPKKLKKERNVVTPFELGTKLFSKYFYFSKQIDL